MIDQGSYKLGKSMMMVDVEMGKMLSLAYADTIEVVDSLGAGKCLVRSPKGDFVAMEVTLKKLYLDGWLEKVTRNRASVG